MKDPLITWIVHLASRAVRTQGEVELANISTCSMFLTTFFMRAALSRLTVAKCFEYAYTYEQL